MRAQFLRRGQGPFLLPTGVEVGGAGNWQDSPAARAALSKRVLYPPAGWPEELDDRSSVSGPLRLTYGGPSFPPSNLGTVPVACLLLRVRLVGGQVPACAVHGPLRLLGHHAGAQPRGWHPAWVSLGVPVSPDFQTLLSLNVPCSRALLGRSPL